MDGSAGSLRKLGATLVDARSYLLDHLMELLGFGGAIRHHSVRLAI
jgi:hypothetical protein